jgi:hypothetical protein
MVTVTDFSGFFIRFFAPKQLARADWGSSLLV